ncbi:MAG: hypothetical protein V4654_00225 [Bdellovibrionota bacterium]
MKSLSLIFILSLLLSCSAFASAFTYGAEFELVHDSITKGWERGGKEQAADAKITFVKNIQALCKSMGCKVEEVQGKWRMDVPARSHDYKVTLSDGWWFKVSHDPGCIEITTKPSTQAELRAREQTLNKMIFESGKPLGFKVPENESAHFNIGFHSAFEGKGDPFLRFFVDYHNRPELALGALGMDIHNGPPLSIMTPKMREALAELVNDHNNEKIDASMIAHRIQQKVYLRPYTLSWNGAHHYQMIGLKHITQASESLEVLDQPFELRAIWNQHDMNQFLLLAELFEARINYLKTKSEAIIYTEARGDIFSNIEKAAGFYNYVTESGLDYERYKQLLPAKVQQIDIELVQAKAKQMAVRLEEDKDKIRGFYKRCAMMF